jgi:hypothetical protein
VSKSFYKKIDQKSKTDFFLDLFYHVFGRFSVRGVQKHDKKYRTNKSDPSPFLASDPPTHHGDHRFLFWRPLGLLPLGSWPSCTRGAEGGGEMKATYIWQIATK